MDKQIARANSLIQQPSKNRKTKFVKAQQQKLELNQELIAKTTKLLGIKGYYTDLQEGNFTQSGVRLGKRYGVFLVRTGGSAVPGSHLKCSRPVLTSCRGSALCSLLHILTYLCVKIIGLKWF